MTLTSKAQANLVGGVSQQPDALRLESQCRVQENAYGTIVEGLKKRGATQWLGNLTATANDNYANASYHWINRDSNERYLIGVVNNTVTGNEVRAWNLDGTAMVVNYPNPGLVDSYVAALSMSDFKWTTVNDFTFLTNKSQIPTLDAAVTASQDQRLAFVYIRQASYRCNYKISATATGGFPLNIELKTWDGVTAATTLRERWRVTIASPFAGSLTVLGYTRNWAAGASIYTTVQNAVAAINAASVGTDGMDDVIVATQVSTTAFDITGKFDGLSFVPTGTGILSVVQQVDALAATEYTSIKTDDIAAELAVRINATSNWTATVSGSVIKLVNTGYDITALETKDSAGDTAMKGYLRTVDNFDELPPRCLDATVIRVQGSVETAEDDFYVKFVTKVASTFGEGEWRETLGPGLKYDLINMPLAVVRRIDTTGAITGTVNAAYFSVEEYSWLNREAGDNDSNPAPSFVDTAITDVFFHKNRLGFLTESSIVLSEAGVYGNFWLSTVRQLLDADPIDLQAAHTSVAKLNHAVPNNERLIVFADRAQFVVTGEPILTPKTASMQFVTAYEADMAVSPVAVGRNLYFSSNRASYSAFWEYQQILENVTAGSYQATNLTSQVPRYIPSSISEIVASPTEEVFCVRSNSERTALYVWKYFINGDQVLQSAWSRFIFNHDIYGMAFYDSTLYMLTKIGSGWAIQKLDIKFGTDSFNPVVAPLIDSRILLDPLTKTLLVSGNTRITLPTGFDYPSSGWTPVVVKSNGTILTVSRVNSSTFDIPGDQTAATGMYFGHPYTMRYQFGRVDVREDTSRGGYTTIKTGRYQNLFGLIKFANTHTFDVTTQIQQESVKTMTFTATVGNDGGGTIKLDNGEYRFPTLTKTENLTVELLNSTPFPSTFLGAEWIANFTTNFQRLRPS